MYRDQEQTLQWLTVNAKQVMHDVLSGRGIGVREDVVSAASDRLVTFLQDDEPNLDKLNQAIIAREIITATLQVSFRDGGK